ncbi:hypothetical protein BDZ45DRAFT_745414 [Acephala macrosclerotiorum]|nr:hypothetical protein BDZ45DRAFT_745414 [Acephala macrosclerotiorum]
MSGRGLGRMGRNRGYLMPPGFRVPSLRAPDAIQLPMSTLPGHKDTIAAAQKKFVDRQKQAKASGSNTSTAKDAVINDYILEVNQAWATMPRNPGRTTLDIARDKYTARIRKALASRASDGGQAAIYKAWCRYGGQEAMAMPQQSRASGGSGAKASESQNAQKPSGSGAKTSSVGASKEAKITKAEAPASGTPRSAKVSNAGSAAGDSGSAKTKPRETEPSISGRELQSLPKALVVLVTQRASPRRSKLVFLGVFGFTAPGGSQIAGAGLGSLEKQKSGSQNPNGFRASETPPPGSGSGQRSSQAVSGSGGKGNTKKEIQKEPKGITKDAKTKEKSKHLGLTGSGSRSQKGTNASSLGRNQVGDITAHLSKSLYDSYGVFSREHYSQDVPTTVTTDPSGNIVIINNGNSGQMNMYGGWGSVITWKVDEAMDAVQDAVNHMMSNGEWDHFNQAMDQLDRALANMQGGAGSGRSGMRGSGGRSVPLPVSRITTKVSGSRSVPPPGLKNGTKASVGGSMILPPSIASAKVSGVSPSKTRSSSKAGNTGSKRVLTTGQGTQVSAVKKSG